MKSNRLFLLGALAVAGVGLGVISLGNMGENLVYFWSPTELVAAGAKAEGAIVRLGGVVEVGTLDWQADAQSLSFKVSDGTTTVDVRATGAPPQMFREGIGVVVEGTLAGDGVFESDRLMVKHSNEYKAPEDGKASDELYETVEGL